MNYRNPICQNPGQRVAEGRLQSLASLTMDLDKGRMYMSNVVLAENKYRVLTFPGLRA